MPLALWIVLFTALGSIASAGFAGIFWLLPQRLSERLLPHFVSLATGALLGAAFLALLPEAIEGAGVANARAIGACLIGGLGLFFVIEKLVLLRHAHAHGHAAGHGHEHHSHGHAHPPDHSHPGPDPRRRATGVLVLIGDSVHNALDGVLIAAAFLTSVPLGILTSLAVAAHEIPHRLGDFVILVHSGLSRGRALLLNLATGGASIVGGLIAFLALTKALSFLPYTLAVAAAGFVYIAVGGLIPDLHRRADLEGSIHQVIGIAAGVALIAWAERLAHG